MFNKLFFTSILLVLNDIPMAVKNVFSLFWAVARWKDK